MRVPWQGVNVDSRITYYYRISPNTRSGDRMADKKTCLHSFLTNAVDPSYTDQVVIIGDGCDEETKQWIEHSISAQEDLPYDLNWNDGLGNAGSFIHSAKLALACGSKYVYFAEDDYLYLPGASKIIIEGIGFPVFSLYDHPDKYTDCVRPKCEIKRTLSCHWRTTVSTTMTFCIDRELLRKVFDIVEGKCSDGIPQDHDMWCEIEREHGNQLWSTVPGYATHSEKEWLSPGTDWYKLVESIGNDMNEKELEDLPTEDEDFEE